MKILPTHTTSFTTQLALLFVGLALSCAPTHAAKLYKWVDAQGRISYQDKAPPKNAKILSEKDLIKSSEPKRQTRRVNRREPVDVYTADNCSGCSALLTQLRELNIPYTEKNIEDHRDIQNRIIQKTNNLRVPALFIDEQLFESSSRSQLMEALEDTDYLTPESFTDLDEENTNEEELDDDDDDSEDDG